jgi:hypothetical protein
MMALRWLVTGALALHLAAFIGWSLPKPDARDQDGGRCRPRRQRRPSSERADYMARLRARLARHQA